MARQLAHNADVERAAIVRYIEHECNIVKIVMTPRSNRAPAPAPAEPPPVGVTQAALRQARALSLDELSRMAGVSKSMLSQIERAQANPTVAVVWRLANALGVPISELLASTSAQPPPAITLVPVHATPSLRNPDGSCGGDNCGVTRQMKQALDSRGYASRHVEQLGAVHDWFYWNERLPGALQFLFPQ